MPKDLSTDNYLPKQGLQPQEPIAGPMPDVAAEANQYSTLEALSRSSSDLIKQREERKLGEYAVEAQSIIEQTSGYSNKREELLAAIAAENPQNREALTRYYQDLSKLRRGEIQGALSPMVASARINTLTKNYINRFPQQAIKLRQIHNGLLDDITKVAGSDGDPNDDPDVKAMNAVIEEATKNGWSPQTQFQINHAKAVADIDKMNAEAMGRAGVLNEAAISKVITSSTDAYYSEAIPNLLKASESPDFNGKDFLAALRVARAEMQRQVRKSLVDAQLTNNLTLSKEFQDGQVAAAVGPLDDLIKVAESIDKPAQRAALSKQLREITDNSAFERMRQKFGDLAVFIKTGDDMMKIAEEVDKLEKMGRAGMMKELESYGKFSFKTRMYLDAIKGPNYTSGLIQDLADIDLGSEPEPSGNPEVDKQRLQDALTLCTSPKASNANKDKWCSILAKSPYSFEAFDKRSGLQKLLPYMTQTQQSLLEASPRQLLEPASKAGQAGINKIKINPAAPEPFSVSAVDSIDKEQNQRPFSFTNPMAGVKYTNSNVRELVERLNQQYRVFSKFMSPAELTEWANTTYNDLRALDQTQEAVSSGEQSSPTTMKSTTSKKTGADGSRTETNTVEVTKQSSMEAEAKQLGMSLDDYTKWVNTPAQ